MLIAVPNDIPNVTVDGKELWEMMMNETERVDPIVMNAILRLKGKHIIILFTLDLT